MSITKCLLAGAVGLLSVLASPHRAAAQAASPNTLVIATTQVPRHFNGAVQSGMATAMPSAQIFASPLRYDENWKPQPYLAQSWDVASDGLSVTLHLVKNALFHDGQPVTSEDVAFSIMAIKANHPFQTMLAAVDKVETPDPFTAVIRLSHPNPALLLAMSPALMPILPKHVYGARTSWSATLCCSNFARPISSNCWSCCGKKRNTCRKAIRVKASCISWR